MKSLFGKLLFVLCMAIPFFSSAQNFKEKIYQKRDIVELESGEENEHIPLEIFAMKAPDSTRFYLSVGPLGVGDNVMQIHFDPLFELFLEIGETLSQAEETLYKIQDLYNQAEGTSMQLNGCLAVGFPNTDIELVTITRKNFMVTKYLEFSVVRDGYIRATSVPKSDFNSLMLTYKLNRKRTLKEFKQ